MKEQVEQFTGEVREKDAERSRLEGAWAAERTELTQKEAALEETVTKLKVLHLVFGNGISDI